MKFDLTARLQAPRLPTLVRHAHAGGERRENNENDAFGGGIVAMAAYNGNVFQ
jgi:hypothetical protein